MIEKKNLQKRKKACYLVFLVVMVAILSSCNVKSGKTNEGKIKLSIIETTDEKNESYIKFYDQNTKKIDQIKINEANVGSVTSYAKMYKNYMYVTAQGKTNDNKTTKVVEVDINTRKIKTFRLKYPLVRDISVDEKNIYAVNSIGEDTFNSYICKYNKKGSLSNEIVLENIIISHMSVYQDIIIAVGMNYDISGNVFSKLYEIDKEKLVVKKELDITNYAISINSSQKVGDSIYFSIETELDILNNSAGEKTEKLSQNIMEYNTKTRKISKIYIGFTTNQIFVYNNYLLITNYDPVCDEGCRLMLYDIKNNARKVFNLHQTIRQAQIDEDYLYVMYEDEFCKYDIKNECGIISKIKLEKNLSKKNCSYNSTFSLKK